MCTPMPRGAAARHSTAVVWPATPNKPAAAAAAVDRDGVPAHGGVGHGDNHVGAHRQVRAQRAAAVPQQLRHGRRARDERAGLQVRGGRAADLHDVAAKVHAHGDVLLPWQHLDVAWVEGGV
jgi:hypothetical protein